MKRTRLRPASPTHAKLWELARKVVFARDGKLCSKCERGNEHGVYVQVHHLIPKSECKKLRYHLDNLIPLCRGCHRFGAHGTDARRAAKFIEELVPAERWAMLDTMRSAHGRPEKFSAVLTELYLRQELAKLGGKP